MRHRIAAALLVALVTIFGWSGQSWAQAKIARIGFLTPASGGVWPEFVAALRALGYVENQTIAFEVRAAGTISIGFQSLRPSWSVRRWTSSLR
jgi:hypothetical protein